MADVFFILDCIMDVIIKKFQAADLATINRIVYCMVNIFFRARIVAVKSDDYKFMHYI